MPALGIVSGRQPMPVALYVSIMRNASIPACRRVRRMIDERRFRRCRSFPSPRRRPSRSPPRRPFPAPAAPPFAEPGGAAGCGATRRRCRPWTPRPCSGSVGWHRRCTPKRAQPWKRRGSSGSSEKASWKVLSGHNREGVPGSGKRLFVAHGCFRYRGSVREVSVDHKSTPRPVCSRRGRDSRDERQILESNRLALRVGDASQVIVPRELVRAERLEVRRQELDVEELDAGGEETSRRSTTSATLDALVSRWNMLSAANSAPRCTP